MWLFVLFLFVPLIEIGLFIQVGGLIGLWPTIGLVVLSAVVGTWLVQRQGLRAWTDFNTSLRSFQDPTRPMAHGVMILLAGILLMTPGFFTDSLGVMLLIPPVRDRLLTAMAGRMRVVGGFGGMRGDPAHDPYQDAWQSGDAERYAQTRRRSDDDVIDADYHPVDPGHDQPRRPRRPSGWTQP